MRRPISDAPCSPFRISFSNGIIDAHLLVSILQMLPFKIIYHPEYDLDLGPHVFPSQKFRMIHDALLEEGIAGEIDFLEPPPATDEDVLRRATGREKVEFSDASRSEEHTSEL